MSINIFEFADIINKNIIITYYPNQKGRFSVSFEYGEIIEKGREHVLCGTYSTSDSPTKAIIDYCKKISGQKIIFNAMNEKTRQQFDIPNLFIECAKLKKVCKHCGADINDKLRKKL